MSRGGKVDVNGCWEGRGAERVGVDVGRMVYRV